MSDPKQKTKGKKHKFVYQSPKGMHDILPRDWVWWNKIVNEGKEVAEFYNFLRIETPLLEDAELFTSALGLDSDVVSKEMFFVKSGGSDKYVLRTQGTASVARAYIEHGLHHVSQPVKLYYSGPMFRHEQPQAGRLREFHQFGFEIMGGNIDPIYDAQIILAAYRMLQGIKLKDATVQINSIGCRVCRPHFKKRLLDHYRKHEKALCADCQRRIKTNPLRLLDCKSAECQPFKERAPNLMDSLCLSCNGHLKGTLEYLDELSIPYVLNPYLVRGLDYYSKTVFEIFAEGYESAIVAGGRYDYLFEMLGGRLSPGVGCALGIERIIEVLKLKNIDVTLKNRNRLFLVYIGDLAKKKALKIIELLRENGVAVREAFGKDLLKKQMQLADKAQSDFALIIGQKEVYEETVIVRDLKSGMQEAMPLAKLIPEIKKRLK